MTTQRAMDPILVLGFILAFAAALTWVLPAGRFERQTDPRTGRISVVPGSYHPVPRKPVGPWGALNSIPQGLSEAADVIFYVLLAGGAITVVEATGVISNFLNQLIWRLNGNPFLVLGLTTALFAIGGASESMYEEILALIPVLCLLVRRLGLDNEMALGMSVGAATVAAAFSPVNTFLLGVSQPAAGLSLFSGLGFRTAVFVCAMVVWIGYLAWYARRRLRSTRPAAVPERPVTPAGCRPRDIAVLATMNGGFFVIVVGGVFFEWGLRPSSAVFVLMAFVAGLAGGLGWRGASQRFAEGLRGMALAAALIGFARAISVVLANGLILDTIANAIFSPLHHFSPQVAAVLMWVGESVLGFPMPSDSGRAMMTMPVAIPLADLLGLSRQMAVIAYQFSALFSGLVTPTAGALLAMLALAKVPFVRWLRFIAAPIAILSILSCAAMMAGVKFGVH